jgi:UDP-glucose 4-epimerase
VRILVTGASGFIGLPVVQNLQQQGHNILALSRSIPNEQTEPSVNWLKADMSLPGTYETAIQSFAPETVIHLAWQGIPDFSFESSRNNLIHSVNLFSFVIGLGSCQKILVSGSCFELNRFQGECPESERGTPKDNFTWAKHSLRSWLEVACTENQIDLGWMRIFYVYGPHQRQESLIPTILNYLQNDKLPELKTPKNANDFVFVDDVAKAFSDAVSNEFPSGIYNLGFGGSTPVLEICRIAEQFVLRTGTLTQRMASRSIDTKCDVDFWADCSQSKKYLGWQQTTSLEEGIKQTWEWLKAQ